jgi:hypothetical protein
MTTGQLFFAIGGLNTALFGAAMAYVKHYMDAKVEPVSKDVRMLVDYMILHQGKIATLEERTKKL